MGQILKDCVLVVVVLAATAWILTVPARPRGPTYGEPVQVDVHPVLYDYRDPLSW